MPKVGDCVKVDIAINNRYQTWTIVDFSTEKGEILAHVQPKGKGSRTEATRLSNFSWNKDEQVWWLKAYNPKR